MAKNEYSRAGQERFSYQYIENTYAVTKFAQRLKEDELWMSNGRINEIWQSGFDDVERRPYITQRWPENFVEIHPDDAKARSIESGDYVIMYYDRVAAHKDTIIGVHNDHFPFSELMKRGHIELSKAAVTVTRLVWQK